MEDVQKTMEYLMEAEELGSDVICIREEILQLHRRANESREAVCELRNCTMDTAYMYEGSLLVRSSKDDIIKRLTDRHSQLQSEIKSKGEEMRKKVFRLQELEMQVPYSGKELMPLDRSELSALSQIWGQSTS